MTDKGAAMCATCMFRSRGSSRRTGRWTWPLSRSAGARALTVTALNGKLDEIVRAGSNTGKKDVLRYLMHM